MLGAYMRRNTWCGRARLIATCVLLAISAEASAEDQPSQGRPRVGVAFGGGSARGLAHVGILRWFEEHHIPIDRVAGTSMGGLIGGAYASGMSAEEIAHLLATTDWDAMFGSSSFRYKNIRRKQDARAYPSRIEFGIKHGLVPPVALNNGQQVDFLLTRIGGAYTQLQSFDDLPTPFRCVSVDLITAQPVVLDRGSLPDAMRATMSLPGIFPPIEIDGRVLVDGGAMNNVPADVVREMGSDVVIAINVGYMGEKRTVNYSLMGLMGSTVDVMMQASTRRAMQAADIIINPRLEGFGSLDWRKNEALADAGYKAVEAMKDELMPLALDDAAWAAYEETRRARRKLASGAPEFLSIVGAVDRDQRRMEQVLKTHLGHPLDVEALEFDLETFTGLDRYETVGWQLITQEGRLGLQIRARQRTYAPPFLMLGVSLQNTTTDEFDFQLAARYLAFDVAGSGSELRVDAAVGVQPNIGFELYRPLGDTPFFVSGSALAIQRTFNFIQDDIIIAKYNGTRTSVGLDGGVNLGRDEELRAGITYGYLRASISAGNPLLPEASGREVRARIRWLHDNQDSPAVPSGGARANATISYLFDSPEAPNPLEPDRSNDDLMQAEFESSIFWSLRRRDRLFVVAGAGTSFDGKPLPTEQYFLGRPLFLGAYDPGALRGDNFAVLTAGYLRGVGRLPDFLGGPIFLGGWLENGSAFDDLDKARLRTNGSVGAILDTLIGPVIVGGSFSFSGDWRYYIGVGRLF
jgi:NTE family protein